MSFLTVNGVAISVARNSASESLIEIGTRERAFSGSLRTDVRATKRKFSMRTPPVQFSDADWIRALIIGGSDALGFETSGMYSDMGRAPVAGAVSAQQAVASDGTASPGAVAGSYALGATPGTTNLLTANQSSIETDTTGFTTFACVFTRSAEQSMFGSYSGKIVTNSTGGGYGGVEIQNISASGGDVVGSVFIKGSGVVDIYLSDSGDTSLAATVVTVTLDGTWQRVVCRGTLTGATTTLKFDVGEHTPDGGITFYIDGLQVEQSSVCTPWLLGGATARAATELEYDKAIIGTNANGYSIGLWAQHYEYLHASDVETLLDVGGGCGVLRITAAGALAYVDTVGGGSASADYSAHLDGEWHHIVIVRNASPGTGRYAVEIYVDGALFAYDATATLSYASMTGLFVGGSSAGADQFAGGIDQVVFFGAPLTASAVASAYAAGGLDYAAPAIAVSGDIVASESVQMRGMIDSTDIVAAHVGGSFRNNARVVAFTLEEV